LNAVQKPAALMSILHCVDQLLRLIQKHGSARRIDPRQKVELAGGLDDFEFDLSLSRYKYMLSFY
jgi:hypothetical protein